MHQNRSSFAICIGSVMWCGEQPKGFFFLHFCKTTNYPLVKISANQTVKTDRFCGPQWQKHWRMERKPASWEVRDLLRAKSCTSLPLVWQRHELALLALNNKMESTDNSLNLQYYWDVPNCSWILLHLRDSPNRGLGPLFDIYIYIYSILYVNSPPNIYKFGGDVFFL